MTDARLAWLRSLAGHDLDTLCDQGDCIVCGTVEKEARRLCEESKRRTPR